MVKIRINDPLAQGLADNIERRFDLEFWFKRELAKGIAQGDAGALARAELIMKRARRLQARHTAKPAR
ncbi:MAG TPA: hypothetical protein VE325_04000 [Burkholderiales bacterium]|nr:hypothetical protein [Burkholderiales bacterium]